MDLKLKNRSIPNEQLRLLFSAIPFSILASLINGGLLVYIERDIISHGVIKIWFGSLLLVSIYRILIYFLYKHARPWPNTDVRWVYVNTVDVLLVSAIWASASIYFFSPDSVANQAFLGFIIAGMSAGATSTLAYTKRTVLIFLLCVLPPLAIQFFMVGTEIGMAMGSMVLLYCLLICSVAIKNYKNSFENIELRFRAEDQQKALKQSEEKYQSIFQSAPLGIFHYTPDGQITSNNNMSLDLIGLDQEALSQINLLKNVEDTEFTDSIITSLNGGIGQYKGSTQVINTDSNKPIRMYCRGTNDSAGKISGGVAILEDITEDKRVDRLKNEFVSTVSHELRTPLTAIYGATELLVNAKSKMSEEQKNSLVINISRNSERLLHLVDDILDIEKITTGKMDFHFDIFSLDELLKQSVIDNQPYAEKYGVSFVEKDIPSDIRLKVDKNRFQQVMANLLSNAAKFSKINSDVLVGAYGIGDNVRIYVKDCGPGIALEFQNKIFEKFSQSDASDTREVGGTGLGLAISKEIVERMNGHLNYETEIGTGSTFYFELPVPSSKK